MLHLAFADFENAGNLICFYLLPANLQSKPDTVLTFKYSGFFYSKKQSGFIE